MFFYIISIREIHQWPLFLFTIVYGIAAKINYVKSLVELKINITLFTYFAQAEQIIKTESYYELPLSPYVKSSQV